MEIDASDFRRIDLNLLVTFMVLMQERSVSRAAERLFLGQPAVSAALARLRRLLDDELLVRTAQGMVPTPKALEIAAALEPAIDTIQRVLFRPAAFDPATDERSFRIAMPDWIEARLMPELLARLAAEAPKVRISTHPVLVQEASQMLADDRIDLGISVFPPGPAWQCSRPLLTTGLCCVFDPRLLKLAVPLTRAQYLDHAHLLVSFHGGFDGLIDQALATTGRRRRISYATERLATLPFLLQRAPLLATVPDSIAQRWRELFGLRTSPLPVRTQALTVSMIWHARTDGDEAHRWLRGCLLQIAAADPAGRRAPRLRAAAPSRGRAGGR